MSSLIINNISDYPVRFALSLETVGSLYFPAKAIYRQASREGLDTCLSMLDRIMEYVRKVQSCREEIRCGGFFKKLKSMVLDTGKSGLDLRSIQQRVGEHFDCIMDRYRELNMYSFPQPQTLAQDEEANETHPSYVRSLDDSSACDRGR